MSRRIPAIDGLRGLAMLTVLIQHLFGKPYDWMAVQLGGFTLFPVPFFSNGFHALGLFFMLSGFVLYLPYAAGKRHMRTARDALRYFRHRSLRLLPLLIGSSIIIAAAYHLSKGTPFAADVLTMLRHVVLHEVDYPLYNGVLWSLRTELWFCLAFPLIVIAGSRYGMRPTALALCVFAFTVKMLSVYMTPELGPKLLNDSVLGRVDDFALGMLVAELMIVAPTQLASRLALPGIALLLMAAFQLTDLTRGGFVTPYAGPFSYVLASVAFACLIGITATARSARLNAFLSLRPLVYLGTVSYSVYIWHVPLMKLAPPGSSLLHLAAYLLTVFAVSWISYRVFERPFLRTRKTHAPPSLDPSPAAA